MRKLFIPTYSGIYKIVNLVNGKVYVGSAENFKNRWKEHFNNLRRGIHHSILLQRSYRKYGEKYFIFLIIEKIEDKDNLVSKEQYWIDYYESYNPKYGYNICRYSGSVKGMKHSPETLIKISISKLGMKHSPKAKKKISDAGKGRKHSLETINKLRNAKIGKTLSPEHCANISKARLKEWNNPEWRAKRKYTPEFSKDVGKRMKELWAKPEFRNKMLNILQNNRIQKIGSK